MKKLLDSYNGVDVIFHGEGDDFIIEHKQDVEPVLEQNLLERNEFTNYTQKGVEWYHVAHIPAVVEIEWREKLGINLTTREGQERAFKLLNDLDYRKLRTSGGKL